MAINFKQLFEGLRIKAKAALTSDTKGELEVDSSSGKLNYHNGTTRSPVVTESHTATLTNKTLTSPVINTPTGITKSDVGLGNVDNTSDATKDAAVATLTNKTLTSPVINSPTGIVKGDVGLGNVDNTSDATKNSAVATLTNKSIDGNTNTLTNVTATTNANLTGPITSVGNATSVASQTGTGSTFVMNTSPTLVTPDLGTPSAVVLTNATGTASGLTAGTVTTNANLTGAITSVGNTTSLGSFTSANLATALTDESGSGVVVFSTSPTLVTPNLGTPSAVVLTNATGTASGLTAGTVTTNANLTGDITSTGNATTYSGTVPLNKGGTGQTTKTAAFDALQPMTTGGDLIYGGASGTGTRLANGSAGQVLTSSGGTAAPTWAAVASAPSSFNQVNNLSFVTSVSSNALTINIKDAAGNTPSATTTAISFRSSSLTSGAFVTRSVTSALSITISSGSTLGHSSGVAKNIWLYAIDNAGTVELAVSSTVFDESYLYSTTAEGGAGAADSESVLYSTTARSNVAIRLIGRMLSTQSTAGTWAVVPTDVSMHGLEPLTVVAAYATPAAQSIANSATPIVDFGTKLFDSHNAVTTGASWKFTAPISGTYLVTTYMRYGNSASWASGSYISANLFKNGGSYTNADMGIQASNTMGTGPSIQYTESIKLLAGEYIDMRASHGESTSRSLLAASAYNRITITRTGNY